MDGKRVTKGMKVFDLSVFVFSPPLPSPGTIPPGNIDENVCCRVSLFPSFS